MYDAFMCHCKSGAGSLQASIDTASSQIEALTGTLETDAAQKSQLEQDVVQHKADLAAAKATIEESTAMRGKEAAEFAASSGEMKSNIEAMKGALAALRKGLSASMLQTGVGQTLRAIVQHSPAVSELERSTLSSFLETGEGGSDQIVGIVDQMRETMESDLKESTASEETAKASFTSLVASKEEEIAAASKAVEEKTARNGELAVSIAQGKAGLKDTEDSKADDEAMKADLAANCATRSEEFDALSKVNAEEIQAISETIEMMSGDDALELFKKTLPAAPAFLQVSAGARLQQRLARSGPQTKVLMLQTHSGKDMNKIVQDIIAKMIANTEKKQADDDAKREFCLAEMAKTEREEKALSTKVGDLESDVAKLEDTIASLTSEVAALQQGLLDLDKSVAEATEQRKEEHAESLSTAASNQAALELLGMAKNRLMKFYKPSLYKAPPTTTVADSPYGFMQLSSESKKADGVLAMFDQIVKDLETEMSEAKHDEEVAQKDYEKAMKEATGKRAADSKLIVEKTDAKAVEGTNLMSTRESLSATRDQLRAAQKQINYLHGSCDELLANYDEKKKERAAENDVLKEQAQTLAGAEPVFLQQ